MKISKWVREERNKEKAVKIGLDKVSVENRWMRWEEIERDMNKRVRTKRNRGRKININKKRDKRNWVENEISKERLEERFRTLLDGVHCEADDDKKKKEDGTEMVLMEKV